MLEFIKSSEEFLLAFGYPLAFTLGFLEASPLSFILPFSWLLIALGFVSYQSDKLLLPVILFLAIFGEWLALYSAYFLGRKKFGHLIKLFKQESAARKAERVFKKSEFSVLTTSMITGLTRYWVAYIAGYENHNFKKFMRDAAIASIFWNALIVGVGFIAGSQKTKLENVVQNINFFGFVIVLFVLVLVRIKIKKLHHR